MKITLRRLHRLSACRAQLSAFMFHFPKGVVPTKGLAEKYVNAFDWTWAGQHLLKLPYMREFNDTLNNERDKMWSRQESFENGLRELKICKAPSDRIEAMRCDLQSTFQNHRKAHALKIALLFTRLYRAQYKLPEE